jgi:hypothetical protein
LKIDDDFVVNPEPLVSTSLPPTTAVSLNAGIVYSVLPGQTQDVHYDNVIADWH